MGAQWHGGPGAGNPIRRNRGADSPLRPPERGPILGPGGWQRTCVSTTRSGPEGSSRNEFPRGSLSGLPPFPLRPNRMTDATSTPTPYRVLARKYRPATFADMIGQDALVRTLTNAIASGRLAQGYMLTGVRGIGKTTTARILARAFNCIGPDGKGGSTATPCGQCRHCLAIAEDRHM